MTELDQRLRAALDKRNALEAQKQRLEGQLEAARKDLEAIEAECRKHGIDPDRLDEAIDKLQERHEALVKEFEDGVAKAEAALAPYMKEDF